MRWLICGAPGWQAIPAEPASADGEGVMHINATSGMPREFWT